jgi:hypothetical protein
MPLLHARMYACMQVNGVTGAPRYDGPAAAGAAALARSAPVSRVQISPSVAEELHVKGIMEFLAAAAAAARVTPTALNTPTVSHAAGAAAMGGERRVTEPACVGAPSCYRDGACSGDFSGDGGLPPDKSWNTKQHRENMLQQLQQDLGCVQHGGAAAAGTSSAGSAAFTQPSVLLARVVVHQGARSLETVQERQMDRKQPNVRASLQQVGI